MYHQYQLKKIICNDSHFSRAPILENKQTGQMVDPEDKKYSEKNVFEDNHKDKKL